jgi:site-specific recombinase XerD
MRTLIRSAIVFSLTRWLRAGIDMRTVQEWLHESLATTQKYLEPSKETEKQLEAMKLPF